MIGSLVDITIVQILQFSLAILVIGIVGQFTYKRWPHFTFLLCMLAVVKCLVPPLIPSPAGVFTWHQSIAFAPIDVVNGEGPIQPYQPRPQSAVSLATPEPASETLSGWVSPQLLLIILGVWLCGSCVIACWAVWQYGHVLRILRRTNTASDSIRQQVHLLCQQLNVKHRVSALVSTDNYGPACIGIWHHRLILPKEMAESWSATQLAPVIAHELVHARRRDSLWGLLQLAALIAWWFHPLVWYIGRKSKLLCERCCDEEVVASLQCSAGEYAESLVRVLEFRSYVRPVPLAVGMSPAEITGHRLQRLKGRNGTFTERTSRSVWCAVIAIACLLLPGMYWPSSPPKPLTAKSEQQLRMAINEAIATGDWPSAVALLKPMVQHQPEDANAVFYLGYALHLSGEIEAAVEYHRRAAQFERLQCAATYNWACGLALLNRTEEALDKLEMAIQKGFRPDGALHTDQDLASLVGKPRFLAMEELVAKARVVASCGDPPNDASMVVEETLQEAEGLDSTARAHHSPQNRDTASQTSTGTRNPDHGTGKQGVVRVRDESHNAHGVSETRIQIRD